jgi:hypothetical protein
MVVAQEHVENVLDLPGHRWQAIGQLATILKLRIQVCFVSPVLGLVAAHSQLCFFAGTGGCIVFISMHSTSCMAPSMHLLHLHYCC